MFSVVPAAVSNSSTQPCCEAAEAVWSIGPHGIPTKSFSARWAIRAISIAAELARPARVAAASVVAHSTAAEEDSPAPDGTVESSARSIPRSVKPWLCSTHSTPTR